MRTQKKSSRWLIFVPFFLTACGGEVADAPLQTAQRALTSDNVFDPNPSPHDGYRVVGKITPPSWSWGEIELLEGTQRFRHEGYNNRMERVRSVDTYQSDKYPLRTYLGALYQGVVDGFNIAYGSSCASGASACADPGPQRPEARYVLLHKGRKTAARTCSVEKTPILLVHGATQDGNVWLFPGGNDGKGGAFPGTVQKTGMVQALEAAGRCVYALTFGNSSGDNYNQAIHVANAIARIRALHKKADGTSPKVDVLGWSKGVLAIDAYIGNAARWPALGSRYFDRIAVSQSADVPLFRGDVRVYIALSGPHKGLDLNFRHPIHTLTVASISSNVGHAPLMWSWFSAVQCVTFGPDSPWYDNPYAASVCEGRGGTWPDFFNRIYVSNITGLDSDGQPVSSDTLKRLNVTEGVPASSFDFDEYNISLFGSRDDAGNYVNAYLGQVQATADLRPFHAVPRRDSSDWQDVDPDENRYFPWIRPKLLYLGGGYLDDPDRTHCRKTAYLPSASPCIAWHSYYLPRNSEGTSGFYSKYELFSGLGVNAAIEMGGHFIARLSASSLDSRLESLYVLYGTSLGAGADGSNDYETDGMSCPTCDPNGDGVLFKESNAALDSLTAGWTAAKKAADGKQEGVAYGHLEMGVTPAVWDKIIAHIRSRD